MHSSQKGVGLIKFGYFARMYVRSPSGVEHVTLDQGYSLLRSGDLQSARGTQATVWFSIEVNL